MPTQIIKFNRFQEDKIIEYINLSINESIDIKSLWYKTIDKLKNLPEESKKRILKNLIASIMAFSSPVIVEDLIRNSEPEIKNMAIGIVNKDTTEWKKGYEFTLSQRGWDHIKDEEKLRTKAYSIGDGMITIGYGHAEPESKSKYKVGDEIAEEEAYELLKIDLKQAADGVRNIFKEWEEKSIDVEINQDMFDALVSIAYNSGIGGLRNSDFIQDIKRGDFEKAGEKIKSFKVSKKFPGLEIRRKKESDMFLASI